MNIKSILTVVFSVAMLLSCNKTPDMKFTSIEFINNGVAEAVEVGNGKKTVLHFYASWCGDCKREMPDANKILSEAPDDIRVYYLTDDSPERKAAMEKQFNIPFPTYQLKDKLKANGITYIPLTYFIDKNGQQVLAQAEQIDWNSTEIKSFLGYE